VSTQGHTWEYGGPKQNNTPLFFVFYLWQTINLYLSI
jgi:hypothetical protein